MIVNLENIITSNTNSTNLWVSFELNRISRKLSFSFCFRWSKKGEILHYLFTNSQVWILTFLTITFIRFSLLPPRLFLHKEYSMDKSLEFSRFWNFGKICVFEKKRKGRKRSVDYSWEFGRPRSQTLSLRYSLHSVYTPACVRSPRRV